MERAMQVLHVDDEKPFLDLTKDSLKRIDDRFEVDSVTDATTALTRLQTKDYDCVVSDYDMPTQDGVSFLQSLRQQNIDVPFILFTGKGSEDVASEAISTGVTGYLQKGGGTEQFQLLANRIEQAISANRAEENLSEHIRQLETLISNLPGVVYRCRAEPGWPMESLRGDSEALFEYPAESLERNEVSLGEDLIHPDDRGDVEEVIGSHVDTDESFEVRYRIVTPSGKTKWVWERGRKVDVTADGTPILEGFITDITSGHHQRERQRVLFEDSADAIVEVTFQDEVAMIDRINPRFEEVFGTTADAVEGEPLNDVIVPTYDHGLAADLDRRVMEGEIVEEELVRETARGPRWFLLRTVPFTLGTERRAYATYIDITDQKEREDAIEALHSAAQEMFKLSDEVLISESAVDAASEVIGLPKSAIYLYDAGSNSLEPVATTDGISTDDGVLPSFTPNDRSIWESFIEGDPTILGAEEDGVEWMHCDEIAANGCLVIPVGDWGILLGISTEQTDFKEGVVRLAGLLASAIASALDAARRESQLENLHEAATDIDSATHPDQVYARLITAAEEILEFDFAVADAVEEDVLITKATSSAVDDESYFERTSIEAEDSKAAEVYRTGEPVITEDLRELDVVPADPEFLSALTVPIDDSGVFQAAAKRQGAFDEDDLELAELLVAHAREALIRLERTRELEERTDELNRQNERLEQFAEIVSHDLRNPLNVIAGRLELAKADPDGEHFEPIEDAIQRMESIIDHTLTLAREGRSVGEVEPIELEEIATSCWARVATGDASIEIVDSVAFTGDSERVKQILENLFRNAIEHGGEGVEIRVGALADGFYVADNGPGIPEDERDSVLQPGYSTSEEGVGIGLAVVSEVAHAHGWSTEITDSWDGGFRIEFTNVDILDL